MVMAFINLLEKATNEEKLRRAQKLRRNNDKMAEALY